MNQVTRKAYAKINLGLDVLRRRPDGYHEVKMVMQTVGIFDTLTFRKGQGKEGLPDISLSVDSKELPCDKGNLIYRAAELIMETYGVKESVDITLKKNIPIAAGMAGGSSDAAAVFHGLNKLFGLSMSLQDMQKLGVKIGADVPYCIMGGTALSEGIGEILTPVAAPPSASLLIAKPDINVSTKFVYENLHADTLKEHPDIDGMVKALQEGSLEGITGRMGNVLETVTIKKYPVIRQIKDIMIANGAENALMSGSGPTVFGIYTGKERAGEAYKAMEKLGLARQIYVTEFV
ncbi:4-(cytidine 5'-diphospho)-2-C-methyl-D-erythritol kinase [Parablautia intestinalis]|uniref:4-(cytidine 5'-diphospho)-2-C-methyl-D-erythritol kinase n=1 Tax=Parablautia intestinalis TaxID=2320100 RepID=UPI00256F4B5F|nr:4-(cytidine 5'-diphospho)-2-C-methyl-D-erythritol kinase [Parablautia intestinalis]